MRLRLVGATLALQRPADQEVGIGLVGVVLEQLGGDADRPVELGGVVERACQQEAYVGQLVPDVGGVVRARALAKQLGCDLAIIDKRRPRANVSFSGGKDSTVVLELARRAGITDAYYVDTGMEFPETQAFVKETGIEKVIRGGDFWKDIKKYGLPRKDDRWCCERLKLQPVKDWLSRQGPCVTVQGNRWYESFMRSTLPPVVENPFNPLQLNISPIRNWRALEVFLYLWWRKVPYNPLYEMGFERVGCWHCPAMLQSEAARTKELHPALAARWEDYLRTWAQKENIPQRCVDLGFWRWKELPPKMRELAAQEGIGLPKPRLKTQMATNSPLNPNLVRN